MPLKPIRWEFNDDFAVYDPDPKYAKTEEGGLSTGVEGAGPPFIPVKDAPTPAPFDLDRFFRLIWKPATKPTLAPQHNFLGAQRQGPAVGKPPPVYMRMPNPTVVDVSKPSQNPAYMTGVVKDWTGMLKFDPVNAYTFRGDSRAANDVSKTGFRPPSERPLDLDYLERKIFPQFNGFLQRRFGKSVTFEVFQEAVAFSGGKVFAEVFTQYEIWRALLRAEEAHIGRMLAQELFKGYISASKAVQVAKGYAAQYGSASAPGWVYCLRIMGGFQIPAQKAHEWTALFGEAEIAHLGAIPWGEIYGFRAVQKASKKFTGPVYLRAGFFSLDKDAAETVYKLLSGKRQSNSE